MLLNRSLSGWHTHEASHLHLHKLVLHHILLIELLLLLMLIIFHWLLGLLLLLEHHLHTESTWIHEHITRTAIGLHTTWLHHHLVSGWTSSVLVMPTHVVHVSEFSTHLVRTLRRIAHLLHLLTNILHSTLVLLRTIMTVLLWASVSTSWSSSNS